MPLTDWLFHVDGPTQRDDGWYLGVRGARRWRWGPFADVHTAQAKELRVFRRWNQAARDRGGWAWKSTASRWVITAPVEVEVAGLPLEPTACTRHHPTKDR